MYDSCKEVPKNYYRPFWEEQLRVVVAEGELLTGRKSRLHKFSIMIEKPDDVEGGLGIATEDDLKVASSLLLFLNLFA